MSEEIIYLEVPQLIREIGIHHWENGLREMESNKSNEIIVYTFNEPKFIGNICDYEYGFSKKWVYILRNNGKYIEKITKYIDYNDPTIIYKEQIEPYVYPAIKIASKIEL